MTENSKRRLLFYLILGGISIVLLASSLPQLNLKPGLPLPSMEKGKLAFAGGDTFSAVSIQVSAFLKNLFLILLAGMLIYTGYRALRGVKLRQLLRQSLFYILMIALALGVLALLLSFLPTSNAPIFPEEMALPPPPADTTPLGAPPASLLWIVGIGLAVCAALLLTWALTSRSRRSQATYLLGQEAEKARSALLNGMDLKDVILQCYRQMSLVIQEEQGIERQRFMTTGEFEQVLTTAGFPADPIHQLTRLFDMVRYGRWQPQPGDEQDAIDCLEAIIQYSQQNRRPGAEG